MTDALTTVAIIAELDGGRRIEELCERAHVWAIGTPENMRAIQGIWGRLSDRKPPGQVTFFTHDPSRPPSPPDEFVFYNLSTIDCHHASYSQTPQWNRAEVYGAPLTPQLRAEMTAWGFDAFEETATGFVATRSKPFADM